MPWTPDEQEVIAAFQLSAPERYQYLLQAMVREGLVWSLAVGNDWVQAGDAAGNMVVPIWPHGHFALVGAHGEWDNAKPLGITLVSWLDNWLPGMENDKKKVVAFPSLNGQGVVLDAAQMALDLRAELKKRG